MIGLTGARAAEAEDVAYEELEGRLVETGVIGPFDEDAPGVEGPARCLAPDAASGLPLLVDSC